VGERHFIKPRDKPKGEAESEPVADERNEDEAFGNSLAIDI